MRLQTAHAEHLSVLRRGGGCTAVYPCEPAMAMAAIDFSPSST